jgi:acyl carrier protein phosphodiesterase
MNYLAHAYLSFGDEEILTGNLISDFVKGKQKFNYPLNIQKGITLHRAIDAFTDDHAATKQAKEFFRPAYRLYSGAFVDVVYDHFLANDKNEFTITSLENFAQVTYAGLDKHQSILPTRFRLMLPNMKKHNWLFNYRTTWGTERSFEGLVHRAKYLDDSLPAVTVFEKNYYALEACYNNFFPSLKSFSQNLYNELIGV